jgi:hypothetical protein
MGMQTDVKAGHLDASGVIFAGPTRVKGFSVSPGGTAGEIEFYDNVSAASGVIRLTLNISTNQALDSLAIPGEGIKFNNGVYVSMPVNAHITVYYG